jgi:prolipoprotein diacylglyceryltransferase
MTDCITIAKEWVFVALVLWGIVGATIWYLHEHHANKKYRNFMDRIAPDNTTRQWLLVWFSFLGGVIGFCATAIAIAVYFPWEYLFNLIASMIPCVRIV